jgi:hypothetical protein
LDKGDKEIYKINKIPARTLYFSFSYQGQTLRRKPNEIFISISRNFDVRHADYYTRFPNSSNIIILADDQRIKIPADTERDKYPGGMNYWRDRAYSLIPTKTLYYIANSDSVESNIADMTFTLIPEQLEAIRDFASHTTP